MALFEWASTPAPWCPDSGAVLLAGGDANPQALFTLSGRRRNFNGFAFWVSCPPEVCASVAARARAYAESAGFSAPVVLSECGPEALGFFRERQWLRERPVGFPGKQPYKALYLGQPSGDFAWVGEVEHWTQLHVQGGLPEALDWPAPPDLMSPEGPFAHSQAYGFLTSHPGYAGTGFHVECGLHLPALTAARKVNQAQQALNALGFEFHPLTLRHSGSAEAGFYRVGSRGGMEFSEENFYRRFTEKVKPVLKAEQEELNRWQEKEKNRLEDRVYRSLRLLQEARTLGYAEFLTFVSFARVGVYLGHFPHALLATLEDLRVRSQPFHIGVLQSLSNPPEEADIFRANMVRSRMEGAVPRV